MTEGENFITRVKRAWGKKTETGKDVKEEPPVSNNGLVEEFVVSNRKYEEVSRDLRLPENCFSPNSRVLSVGEGLSGFASKLKQEGIEIVALDPIYSMGRELFGKSIPDTEKIIQNRYKGRVKFVDYRFEKIASDQPEEPLIAGSVHSMPFPDDTFTHVFGHRIFEHVDLSEVLPEMVRVLKKGGEIRLGGVMLSALAEEKKLLAGMYQYDGLSGGLHFESAKGMMEAFLALSRNKDLKMYVILDGLPHRSEVRETGSYIAGVIVIRKDNEIPKYTSFSEEERKQYYNVKTAQEDPCLGRIYEVNFSNFKKGYYEMIPAGDPEGKFE